MRMPAVENCLRRVAAIGSFAAVAAPVVGAAGCNAVDCQAVCNDALPCEVAFAPADDPAGDDVTSGKRSDMDSCVQGCRESQSIDLVTARCIDQAAKLTDREDCQDEILACLGELTSS